MTAHRMTTPSVAALVIPRWLACVALSGVALAACTSASAQDLSGVYSGGNCPYKLTFRPKGVVYIDLVQGFFGVKPPEAPGQYKVDGDKVSVTTPNGGVVFTRKGNALEITVNDSAFVCTRLSAVAVARAPGKCDEWHVDYNKDNICYDTAPVPVLPQTAMVHAGGARVVETVARAEVKNRWGFSSSSITGASAIPTPVDVSVVPQSVLVSLRVSAAGQTDTAKADWRSNVGAFDAAALEVAKQMRWHPAQKHGEAVDAWVTWEFQAVAPAASGFISVNLNVNGVSTRRFDVRIDNTNAGLGPLSNFQVRSGEHSVRVEGFDEKLGRLVMTDTVHVDSGATVVKSFAAKRP